MTYRNFPLVAIVGQERVKRALLLNLVNPRIGGVLLCGEKGTAKSSAVRALAELLPSGSLVEVPLNVTPDRLVGGVDIEAMVKNGERRAERGLLAAADGGILYVDEINLISEHVSSILLEVAAEGVNRVERDGISHQEAARFSLVGSMNPEEGALRPQLLERFGLFVACSGEAEPAARAEIVKRRLAFERDALAFRAAYEKETAALKHALLEATRRLPEIAVDDTALRDAAYLAHKAGAEGNRTELILIETARAIAALDGLTAVNDAALREAAAFVLPHRMREPISLEAPPSEMPPQQNEAQSPGEPPKNQTSNATAEAEKDVSDDGGVLQMGDIPLELQFKGVKSASGSGKRTKVRSNTARGRYIRERLPQSDKAHDIAVTATIRSAALHKKDEGEMLAVSVRRSDLREKVREQRSGATILFLVDASASMGAGKRMAALRGAVLSLLTNAYQKRDAVGIMAFREARAELILPFTRSVDLARKKLSGIKTGGKTPLALGISRAHELLKAARVRDKELLPFLVLLSDGRANLPFDGTDAFEDAVEAARRVVADRINLLLLDTEMGRIRFDMAKKLAERADCAYVKLAALSGGEIEQQVTAFLKN